MLLGSVLLYITTRSTSGFFLRPTFTNPRVSSLLPPTKTCLFCDPQGQERKEQKEQQEEEKKKEIDVFLAELKTKTDISSETADILRKQKISRSLLLVIDRSALAELKIDAVDAIRLVAWSISVKEEEKQARQKQDEEEKQARRKQDEAEKLARWKNIFVHDVEENTLIGRDFQNDADLKFFLQGKRATGLRRFENGTLLNRTTPFKDLAPGGVYCLDSFTVSDVDKLQIEMSRLVRSRIDFTCAGLLRDLFVGQNVTFLGNDIQMIDANGKTLGDLDTVFKVEAVPSSDASKSAEVLVVVERKTTVNLSSEQQVLEQINKTAKSFRSMLANKEFCESLA